MPFSIELAARGIPLLSREIPWATEEDEEMRVMGADGSSLHLIGKRLNRSLAAVPRRASRLAIQIPLIVEDEQTSMRFDFLAEPAGLSQVTVWAKEAANAYAQAIKCFAARASAAGVMVPLDVRLVSMTITKEDE